MKIEPRIIEILEDCKIEGDTVYLPPEQLDRKTYLAVNKCLESLGGKWNRKAKGHAFDGDPASGLQNIIDTGEATDFKKEFQFFETPPGLARQMVEMADIQKGDVILEPSAGKGAIIDYIALLGIPNVGLIAIELNPKNVALLLKKKVCAFQQDFLIYKENSFNKIIMNPPFTRQQDIDHILHAYSLLANHGILVSVVSESPFFRTNKKSIEFREFLGRVGAEIIINEDGTFRQSGTLVSTRTIKICS